MPSSILSLDWRGDLKFSSSEGSPNIELESGDPNVATPPQALAYAAMACMGMDVVHILQKGRHELTALKVKFEGTRAETHPRRYTAMDMKFEITGNVPDEAASRAIELSREKYCTVTNTLNPDIAFTTTFTITK